MILTLSQFPVTLRQCSHVFAPSHLPNLSFLYQLSHVSSWGWIHFSFWLPELCFLYQSARCIFSIRLPVMDDENGWPASDFHFRHYSVIVGEIPAHIAERDHFCFIPSLPFLVCLCSLVLFFFCLTFFLSFTSYSGFPSHTSIQFSFSHFHSLSHRFKVPVYFLHRQCWITDSWSTSNAWKDVFTLLVKSSVQNKNICIRTHLVLSVKITNLSTQIHKEKSQGAFQ